MRAVGRMSPRRGALRGAGFAGVLGVAATAGWTLAAGVAAAGQVTAQAAASASGSAADLAVPSGHRVVAHDAHLEQQGADTVLILRYLAPWISQQQDYTIAGPDMDHLCATDGVNRAQMAQQPIDQIVITLMDHPIDRGVTDPRIVQFFGAYRLIDGTCILEPF